LATSALVIGDFGTVEVANRWQKSPILRPRGGRVRSRLLADVCRVGGRPV